MFFLFLYDIWKLFVDFIVQIYLHLSKWGDISKISKHSKRGNWILFETNLIDLYYIVFMNNRSIDSSEQPFQPLSLDNIKLQVS